MRTNGGAGQKKVVKRKVAKKKGAKKKATKNKFAKKKAAKKWLVHKGVTLDSSEIPIIATVGPSIYNPIKSNRIDRLEKLLDTGVSVFRINFSHVSRQREKRIDNNYEEWVKIYSYDDVKRIIKKIRGIEEKKKIPIPIMMDLKGPEIRVKEVFENGKIKDNITVKDGDIIYIWQQTEVSKLPKKNFKKLAIVTFEGNFPHEARSGKLIRVDDGRVELRITMSNEIVTTNVIT